MADLKEEDHRKTVLITGCTPGGIGYSLALAFQKRNFRVFATVRNPDKPNDEGITHLKSLGIEVLPLEVDSDESILNLHSTISTKLTNSRGLDYLVNNAGTNYTVPALDLNVSEVRAMFNTNVFAVMRITQVFAHLLVKSGGTIVMIASVAGACPYVFGSAYNASKAALQAYSNTLRVELAPLGVDVQIIMTGGVKTNIANRTTRNLPEESYYRPVEDVYMRRQTHSQEGAMTADDFAESVVWHVTPGVGGGWPWRYFLRDARKRWIWEGRKSWLVWFLSGSWTWTSVGDLYMNKVFSLWRLKGTVKNN